MTLREWLILIGILVICGVVIDGYRRMRLAKKRATELSFGLEEVKGYDENFRSELPNGGARRTRAEDEHGYEEPVRERVEPGFSSYDDVSAPLAEESFASDSFASDSVMDEPSPLLQEQESLSSQAPFEPDLMAYADDYPEPVVQDEPVPVLMNLDDSVNVRESSVTPGFEGLTVPAQEHAPEVSANTLHEEPSGSSKQQAEKLSDRPPAREVIVINVLAKGDNRFDGSRLLQSVLTSGMSYGDMAIFHRYENPDGFGKILFSMANGVEPGTFDFDNLEYADTPAVSLFMGMPGPENPQQAFSIMEETARRLALDLGGELKDEQFSVMTQQTLEHCRQRIREYERKQLAHKVIS